MSRRVAKCRQEIDSVSQTGCACAPTNVADAILRTTLSSGQYHAPLSPRSFPARLFYSATRPPQAIVFLPNSLRPLGGRLLRCQDTDPGCLNVHTASARCGSSVVPATGRFAALHSTATRFGSTRPSARDVSSTPACRPRRAGCRVCPHHDQSRHTRGLSRFSGFARLSAA